MSDIVSPPRDPLTASVPAPGQRSPSAATESCAAIWIGIHVGHPAAVDDRRAQEVTGAITAFIADHLPELDVSAHASTLGLCCAGSLTQVMHIADDLAWYLHCLCRSEEMETFDADMGVAIAAAGEAPAALLRRAEIAAEELHG